MLVRKKFTDHQLADYLRRHDATDYHEWIADNVGVWRKGKGGAIVVLAVYDNAAMTREVFCEGD